MIVFCDTLAPSLKLPSWWKTPSLQNMWMGSENGAKLVHHHQQQRKTQQISGAIWKLRKPLFLQPRPATDSQQQPRTFIFDRLASGKNGVWCTGASLLHHPIMAQIGSGASTTVKTSIGIQLQGAERGGYAKKKWSTGIWNTPPVGWICGSVAGYDIKSKSRNCAICCLRALLEECQSNTVQILQTLCRLFGTRSGSEILYKTF